MQFSRIILKSGKDQAVRRYHPWIFSGAIREIAGDPAEGDVVKVYDNKGSFLAVGHYQPGSIAVRILSFDDVEPGEQFLRERIRSAYALRQSLGLTDNAAINAFRLIHAEGDNLPGLIADFYNGVVVIQAHSVGMYRMRGMIVEILGEVLGEKVHAIYDKSASTLSFMAGITGTDGFISGSSGPAVITEYGFRFRVDWESGQKTGFFIDQRENRKLLGEYSGGKNVLNMFGYTGGFSVYALRNAELVHTVDSSAYAIGLTDENVRLNYGNDQRHRSFQVDAFDFLNDIKGKYDLIVLDPPAFAKHNRVLSNALKGYRRLNMKAIEQIRPGGIIFTFSCSQVVSREDFRLAVFSAAAGTGRKVRILHQMSQPPDHPVNIYHPEGEYLKGLVLQVE